MRKKEQLSNYYRVLVLVLLVAVCLVSDTRVGFSKMFPQPKRLEKALPGNCSACHGNVKILPNQHTNTNDMDSTSCAECHKGHETSLRSKIPLSHTHLLNGVNCVDCHEASNSAKPLTTEQCLSCHGSFDEVAGATHNLDPNPHDSPHYGTELDCDLCHHQHSKSENFCTQCHEWELCVP